ncbi:hypothetical protein M406DRAFT_358643 [Cryphonectria parasitica EP155]|uniref:Uncharacterized protein n=1 Tax=Cryphonectria parasitica (strain ATCC 38755 / EP155) TaxID=660469 RepID=A0A9P4XSE5_CRYP1|nr:uncharacterized protein M406DRAFT_358643 [Cryphonectria parasitica EP155]KAF3759910.1 hypothetical protein M406DRAFT_358643 [Cryphonectria parasitica EP155]
MNGHTDRYTYAHAHADAHAHTHNTMGIDPYQNALGSSATGSGPSSSFHTGVTDDTSAHGHKRKLKAETPAEDNKDSYAANYATNEAYDGYLEDVPPNKKTSKAKTAGADGGEKRLRRPVQPQTFVASRPACKMASGLTLD